MKTFIPFTFSVILHGIAIGLLSSCSPKIEAEKNVIDFMRSETRVKRLGKIPGQILSHKVLNHRGTWFAVIIATQGYSHDVVVFQFDTEGQFVRASHDPETTETLVSVAIEQGWPNPQEDGVAVLPDNPEAIIDPMLFKYDL